MNHLRILFLLSGMCFLVHFSSLLAQTPELHSSALPSWVFNKHKKDGNMHYAVGVSDPHLNEKQSYKQAVLRGAAILSMVEGFTYSKTVQSFREERNGKIRSVNKRLVNLHTEFDTLGIKVERIYRSKFNECFVLLSKAKCQYSRYNKEFEMQADCYFSDGEGTNSSDRAVMSFVVVSKNNLEKILYTQYSIDKRYEMVSNMGDSINLISDNKYIYKDENKVSEIQVEYSSGLSQSFWVAYISCIIDSLNFHINDRAQNTSLKGSGLAHAFSDTYIADEDYCLSIGRMMICNNKLYVNSQIDTKK
ncbi:hypothetical protein L3073_09465 [Ancylomarina sp. DW003]|nr:hypothetical protein [Ancylomarina sp. DW003]MDE5422433.1 hypothetical protein [Ancylomarina sp. DW003]